MHGRRAPGVGEHLGESSTALVDGSLGHDARDRALIHLTHCADCRCEVDTQRRLKATLAGLPDPVPPGDLGARLRDIGRSPTPPNTGSGPDDPAGWMTAAALCGPTLGGSRLGTGTSFGVSGRTARRLLSGAAVVVVATGVTVVMLPRDRSAPVAPALTSYTVQHAATADEVPGADPAEMAAVVVSTHP